MSAGGDPRSRFGGQREAVAVVSDAVPFPSALRGFQVSRLAACLVSLLATVALVLGAPGAATADEGETMTTKAAGNYYLKFACQKNAAVARFSRAMFHDENRVTRAEMRERMDATRRAANRASNVFFRGARRFDNPPAAWPSSVTRPIARLVVLDLRMSGRFDALAGASNAGQMFHRYDRMFRVYKRVTPVAKKIRLELGLPNNGKGC